MCYSLVMVYKAMALAKDTMRLTRKRSDSETESWCTSFLNGCITSKRGQEMKTANVIF